jgi:uncharacterized membrane protein YdbT with pleckstrin-like domain
VPDPEPGEEIFFHGHPSWRSILSYWVRGLVLMVAAGAIAGLVTRIANHRVQVGWVAVAVLIAMILVAVVGVVRLLSTTYTISNQRLTIQTGLLSRDFHETRLERVQNVNARQSFVERILQIGTVDFDTAASGNFDFSFSGVSNPRGIVRVVDRALRGPDPGV